MTLMKASDHSSHTAGARPRFRVPGGKAVMPACPPAAAPPPAQLGATLACCGGLGATRGPCAPAAPPCLPCAGRAGACHECAPREGPSPQCNQPRV